MAGESGFIGGKNIPLCKSEVFTAVTIKNAVFWDEKPCDSCEDLYFGGTYRLRYC
jgi:hypothetical protein